MYIIRWLKEWGVVIASEGKMRAEAGRLIGDNLAAEIAPFSFSSKESGIEIKPAPFVFVPHLWNKVLWMLEENGENGYTNHV